MNHFVYRLSGFNTGTPTEDVPNVIKQYTAVDMRLAWKPTKSLEIAVVGQNLLDSRHPELGTNSALRSPLIEIERSVYAEITYRW